MRKRPKSIFIESEFTEKGYFSCFDYLKELAKERLKKERKERKVKDNK